MLTFLVSRLLILLPFYHNSKEARSSHLSALTFELSQNPLCVLSGEVISSPKLFFQDLP